MPVSTELQLPPWQAKLGSPAHPIPSSSAHTKYGNVGFPASSLVSRRTSALSPAGDRGHVQRARPTIIHSCTASHSEKTSLVIILQRRRAPTFGPVEDKPDSQPSQTADLYLVNISFNIYLTCCAVLYLVASAPKYYKFPPKITVMFQLSTGSLA